MGSYANFTVMGRLGSDVIDHGKYVSFNLMTDKNVKQKDGTWDKQVQSFHMKAFGKVAEFIKSRVGKGDLVLIDSTPDFSVFKKEDGTFKHNKSFNISRITF